MLNHDETNTDMQDREKAINYLKKGDEFYNAKESGKAMELYLQGMKMLENIKKKEDSKDNKWYLAMAYERVGRVWLLFDENFVPAAQSLGACAALREDILAEEGSERAEKELRFAYELAGTAYVQVDRKRGREYLLKHNDLCKKIADRTQLAKDYLELADSCDYLLDLYEDGDKKTQYIVQMMNIYQQILSYRPDNQKIAEKLEYAENLYVEHGLKHELKEAERELEKLVQEKNYRKAGKCCEEIAQLRTSIAIKQNPGFTEVDNGIEFYHNAAENYKKGGDIEGAVRCYEKAIDMRSAVLDNVAGLGKDSKTYEAASARLGYSYLMAAATEPSGIKKKDFARKAYDIFNVLSEKHPEDEKFREFRKWMTVYL